jgi:hypothetical protein
MGAPVKPRVSRRRIGPEAQLQAAVCQYLRLAGTPDLTFFSVPNESKRSPAEGARLKAIGLLPGVADLLLFAPNHPPSALELKAHGKKLSPEQTAFAIAWHASGGRYQWADNIDTAIHILISWGLIDRLVRGRAA